MCHALPREHWGSPSPAPCQPRGCASSTHTPPHAGPGPRDCPAPFASCLHLPGGAPVGPHHAKSPLRGDKSPLLASPSPAAPRAVHCTHKVYFCFVRWKRHFQPLPRGFYRNSRVRCWPPAHGQEHPQHLRVWVCRDGCAHKVWAASPGLGRRRGGIAACPLRHFYIYNGRR